jgi:hypothetical protein
VGPLLVSCCCSLEARDVLAEVDDFPPRTRKNKILCACIPNAMCWKRYDQDDLTLPAVSDPGKKIGHPDSCRFSGRS